MWLWWFWLICDLLIPFVMIVVGRMSWKHCPKNINSLIGYRTTRSMKSMDTWKFAHEYCGKLWWKLGWLIMILTALMYIPLYQSNDNMIGIAGGCSYNNSVYCFDHINLSDRESSKRTFQ